MSGAGGVWAAPGRINLIGEHTDYNDGFVLPLALAQRVRCAATVRADRRLVLASAAVDSPPVEVGSLGPGSVAGWAAYPAGVVWALRSAGHPVGGLDLRFSGDVPLGAGLSSSAALLCSVALACNDLFALGLSRTALAIAAREAETTFVGAPVGIMDQLAAMHGVAGHALFVDTRSLAVAPVPLALAPAGLALLVVDTKVRHAHVDSAYAARRRDCAAAASVLGRSLRSVTVADLRALSELGALHRRARHVVTENARVLHVVELLRSGADPRQIGPVLTASHESLRTDFEASCPELDRAVEAALSAGAHGARMTGGGFGGCAIALVDAPAVDTVTAAVADAFARSGYAAPATFTAIASDGARRIA